MSGLISLSFTTVRAAVIQGIKHNGLCCNMIIINATVKQDCCYESPKCLYRYMKLP